MKGSRVSEHSLVVYTKAMRKRFFKKIVLVRMPKRTQTSCCMTSNSLDLSSLLHFDLQHNSIVYLDLARETTALQSTVI